MWLMGGPLASDGSNDACVPAHNAQDERGGGVISY
jgi:hypothetical protein